MQPSTSKIESDRTHRSLGPGPMARLCKKLGLVGFWALPEYVSYTTPQLLVELAGLVVELGWPRCPLPQHGTASLTALLAALLWLPHERRCGQHSSPPGLGGSNLKQLLRLLLALEKSPSCAAQMRLDARLRDPGGTAANALVQRPSAVCAFLIASSHAAFADAILSQVSASGHGWTNHGSLTASLKHRWQCVCRWRLQPDCKPCY